jgi:putative proteasome-type protease
VALRLNRGLVFMSDTRTNAGVDNVAVFKKMVTWRNPGERLLTLMTAGNLATTQAVVSLLDERTKAPADRRPSILEAPTLFQAARIVGETLREQIRSSAPAGAHAEANFHATMILGGQIAGIEQRLFLIYPEGNFIEASDETPFFQIGETKYGRPILVRAYDPEMSYQDAVKLLLVSFDSTLKANLSVGMPLDLQIVERDTFEPLQQRRIHAQDPYYRQISSGWGEALKQAFHSLPDYEIGLESGD